MNKLMKVGRKALMLLTMTTLLLSLPLGMDAKKRSSNRSRNRTTTTTTNKASRKTIVLRGETYTLSLFPAGAAWIDLVKGKYPYNYTETVKGTWTLRQRSIGYGNIQSYYEVNVGGTSLYWVLGEKHIFIGYTNFCNSDYKHADIVTSWEYL